MAPVFVDFFIKSIGSKPKTDKLELEQLVMAAADHRVQLSDTEMKEFVSYASERKSTTEVSAAQLHKTVEVFKQRE